MELDTVVEGKCLHELETYTASGQMFIKDRCCLPFTAFRMATAGAVHHRGHDGRKMMKSMLSPWRM